ncbi:hypothetical protein AURDEDRAFT_144029 [Auricularia subglabra TFB-10046 SS5]|nr:hypothetical protein AURDEDRAFT_144029 [Auricularia subglabra TFB-10046 SS5]
MSSDSAPDTGGLPLLQAPPSASLPLLICVFIHGFKGTDSTFGGFPERLKHILAETIDQAAVDCIVFPAYETKGELNAAVEKFADWLSNLTVEREVAHGGAGKARIVLVGHSMGGLLAADTLIALYKYRVDDKAPLWPNIIACIAFDTPYLGLHPGVFANKAEQAISYVQTARDVATTFGLFTGAAKSASQRNSPTVSTDKLITAPPPPPAPAKTGGGWTKWAPALGGALLAAGAAGAAYYKRDDLTQGLGWANDHMKYVGNLWEEKALHARLDALARIRDALGVRFKVFYTVLDAKAPGQTRTFCVLPKRGSRDAAFFEPAHNKKVTDEVDAHVSMFDPKVNDGYYDLGLRAAHIIRDAMLTNSVVVASDAKPPAAAEPVDEPLL